MLKDSLGFFRSLKSFAGAQAYIALTLVLAAALLEGIGILLIVPFLELLTDAPQSSFAAKVSETLQAFNIKTPQAQLVTALASFLVILVIRNLVIWARDIRLMALSIGFVNYWQSRIFHALAGASWASVIDLKKTDIEHAVTNDVMRLMQGTDRLLRGGTNIVLVIVQLIIVIMLTPMLSLFIIAFIIISAALLTPLLRKARKLGELLTQAGRNVHSVLGQFLSGLKLAKIHDSEQRYVEKFDEDVSGVRRQIIDFTREQSGFRLIFQTMSGVAICGIVLAGVFVFETPIPALTVILLIMARLSGPLFAVLQAMQGFSNMLPAFQTIQELDIYLRNTSSPSSLKSVNQNTDQKLFGDGPVAIELTDIHFRHTGQIANTLSGASMTIQPGQITLLIGPSGAGKTTLLDILVGLLSPASGTIKINNKVLPEEQIEQWRQALAYVPQDPILFDQSIRENLLWAQPDSSEADLWQALELAQAASFVKRFDEGLDYRVGERGQALSGGERQRICLARALLRRPQMLILDEATNAMDVALEQEFLDTLRLLRQQMTVLMITHRHSIRNDIDQVFVLRDGRITRDNH